MGGFVGASEEVSNTGSSYKQDLAAFLQSTSKTEESTTALTPFFAISKGIGTPQEPTSSNEQDLTSPREQHPQSYLDKNYVSLLNYKIIWSMMTKSHSRTSPTETRTENVWSWIGCEQGTFVLGEKAVDIVQGPFVAVEEQQLKSWQTMQQKSNYSIAQALQEAKVFEQYAIDVTESATQNSTSSTTLQHFF
jgi:hypothetical protein